MNAFFVFFTVYLLIALSVFATVLVTEGEPAEKRVGIAFRTAVAWPVFIALGLAMFILELKDGKTP